MRKVVGEIAGMLDRHHVDVSPGTTIVWSRNAMEAARALARKVLWAKDHRPSEIDATAVYVFDASSHDSNLSEIRDWVGGLPQGRPPLTVVVAPKVNELMTTAEHHCFESAIGDLWVYPLSRPAHDGELLAYVSSILTLGVPPVAPIPVRDISVNPLAGGVALREIDFADRFD